MPKIIELTPDAKGIFFVDLDTSFLKFTTSYNYSIEAWVLDIFDVDDAPVALGLMLYPWLDLLDPYTQTKDEIGSLVLIEESPDDYKLVDGLGVKTKLLWYPPGEEVVIPS